MKVKELIEQLSSHDPEEPVLVQYLLAEHTYLSETQLEMIVEYLEQETYFADEISIAFDSWIEIAQERILNDDGEDS